MSRSPRPTQSPFARLDSQTGWRIDVANSDDIRDDELRGGLRLSGRGVTAISPVEPNGTFAGLTLPTGLTPGPDNRLFLADPDGNRILTYTTHDEAFVALWEPRLATPPDAYTLQGPRGVAISSDGDLVVADTGHARVIVYTWPRLAPRTIIDLAGGEPWDIEFDRAGHLYIADPVGRRVHRFDRLWRRDATYEGGSGLLSRPRHLAFDDEDRLYVVDDSLKLVVELDPRGRPLPTHDAFAELVRTRDEARDGTGRAYVADAAGDEILTRAADDEPFVPLADLAAGGSGDAFRFQSPQGVGVSLDDSMLAVSDTGNRRVIVYRLPEPTPIRILGFPEGSQPVDATFDTQGNLYVADRGAGRIHRFDPSFVDDRAYEGGAGFLQSPLRIATGANGRLLVRDEGSGQIIVLDAQGIAVRDELLGGRAFPPPLRLDRDGVWLPQAGQPDCPALPLAGIAVDRRGRLDADRRNTGRWPALLARPTGPAYPRDGRFVSLAIDSQRFNCAWHRIVLDADIPPTTSLAVRTLTEAADLDPVIVAELPADRWADPIVLGPDAYPEVLVQSPPGRYLLIQIDFHGSGHATPVIRAITLYAPRQSSLGYLPPVFQQDTVSASFLDRFLSYFDTVFAEIEMQIEAFGRYLDPDAVPAGEFLAWLGSWLDIRFLAEWPEATRRAFIREAIPLYQQRGTVSGLRHILQLHTGLSDTMPALVEHFRLRDYLERREPDTSDLVDDRPWVAGIPLPSDDTDDLAHAFTVVVPSKVASDEAGIGTLRQLIETHKPAHTGFQLRVVHPGIRIGCQSMIGVDMLIGQYPAAPIGEMALGGSSQLAPGPTAGLHVGHSRLPSGA